MGYANEKSVSIMKHPMVALCRTGLAVREVRVQVGLTMTMKMMVLTKIVVSCWHPEKDGAFHTLSQYVFSEKPTCNYKSLGSVQMK